MVDEVPAQSFRNAGEDFDRVRPGFPADAADAAVPTPVGAVLDPVSSFLAASDDEDARMVADVARVLDTAPEAAGGDEFDPPQPTDVDIYGVS
ncbi:hypothetical protein [Microbacterium sp. NPDC057650]|uniref:hypothetical protein n=1 Tax=unclassified Microbacterium TaxID=2609290 RepID=UPI00366BE942